MPQSDRGGAAGDQIVACPRPFIPARHVALALAEAGRLRRYVTGFVWDWDSRLGRMLKGKRAGRLGQALERRTLPELAGIEVESFPLIDAGRSFFEAIKRPGLADWAWEVEDKAFDRRTAARTLRDCRAIHGFEHSSLETFRRARALGVKTILHLSSEHPNFHDRVLQAEIERHPEAAEETERMALLARRGPRDARRIEEFGLSDLIVVYSNFAKRSLVEEGIPEARVAVARLGAPLEGVRPERGPLPMDQPMTVLFAGLAGMRKGCHLLLEAWERARPEGARLVLAGRVELPTRLVERPGVEALGPVPQERLFDLMRTSDLLAFPSLCDSFGMVVAEAHAHGLPALVSTHVGAADLVRDGVNGWVVPAGDADALAERITWCSENLGELRAMRAAVIDSAPARGWEAYRQELRDALREKRMLD